MGKKKLKKINKKQEKKIKKQRLEIDSLYNQHLAFLCFLQEKHLLTEYMEMFYDEDELPFK